MAPGGISSDDQALLDSLVPGVISAVPGELLRVSYADNVDVRLGDQLRPRQARERPISLTWITADPDALYSLLMIDPDAPSRQAPVRRDCLHWMVVDVRGADVQSGRTLGEYIGPGPPQGTGLHRYVFLVCQQDPSRPMDGGSVGFISRNQILPRLCFKTQQFLSDHGLRPVAINFFVAEWDDYVPELHAQFTDRR